MEEFEIDGKVTKQTDEPLSPQEAGEWALTVRKKVDPRKAAIERLRCAAGKRRQKTSSNPLDTSNINPTYRVTTFNAEADSFNVEGSDGKKLLGRSLSNGNVKSGQKVRSFFAPNGQVVIDVKPKGKGIVIPKPQPKPKKEAEEFWPVTSCFLYSKVKNTEEDLTDNMATDLTSYDAWWTWYPTSNTSQQVIGFAQRSDLMGDYATATDALNNNIKEDRKLKPGNTGAGSGGGADDAAWGSGSADAVIIWYYIGDPSAILPNGKIFKVTGPPTHPSAGNVTDHGPGLVMQVSGAGIASAIFPNEQMGVGPLTRKLKESFPDLGGKIGYAGRIAKWRGQQDYASSSGVYYFRNTPQASVTPQSPVSFPPSYVPGQSPNPWLATNANWFQFGWPDPQYIGCASSAWVNANSSALVGVDCGASIPNDQWYWGGDATPNYGRIDKSNPSGYIGTSGMFVCWQGHKDNAGLAMSFFQAFKDYWGINGSVTVLGTANPFGCGVGAPATGSYPPPPPGPQRFLVRQFGRKAEIWLKVCEKDYPPIELKLPFEFAALLQKYVIQGDTTFISGSKIQHRFNSFGSSMDAYGYTSCLECPHATMSVDDKFIYINISYGAEREWEDPLSRPIPSRLSNLGVGNFSGITSQRKPGKKESGYTYMFVVGEYKYPSQVEIGPRYKADYFSYCQSFKVALPTSSANRTLTIVESQRYRRGEAIQITEKSPDSEFDNKFLIFDFRTDKRENLPLPPGTGINTDFAPWQSPNPEYASFGGLPALLQFQAPGYPINNLIGFNLIEKFYKPQSLWTDMDRIHYHLQESPESFWPVTTILPMGESVAQYKEDQVNIRFLQDGKFGRGGRASSINLPSYFGLTGGPSSPTYTIYADDGTFLLFTSFKEQLIGNGIKDASGLVTKWNRVSTSSFPIFGQLKRNPQ